MASYYPLVGTWYRDQETQQRFEVVAIDEKQRTIEIQYFDGDISEFDIESWGSLSAIETDAPEEAYSSLEGVSPFADNGDSHYLYANPLESIEPDSFTGYDDPF
ncbi:DUF6763 family protein [Agaribacterium sp. ZY112]|uniref:DUF6763 family protein n=1 Tax=Agaribacterium sp. ZY112 TaxID=3233574 RepID=UPI0035237DE1